jgi:uncharacterized protein (TIGR01777 family)
VRRAPQSADEARWTPGGTVDLERLGDTDAVVHLAAPSMGGRPWTPGRKEMLRRDRVEGTGTIASALATLAAAGRGPRTLLTASAVGVYGATGDAVIDESSPRGRTELAEIAAAWEHAAQPAVDAGCRVVYLRSGVIVAHHGALMDKLLPFFRLGLGGRLGSGRQFWSWVSLHDHVRAMRHLLADDSLSGPVNVTSPKPVTNAEFTAALGRALHRPSFLRAPGLPFKVVLGGFGADFLAGQRVVPTRLDHAGFEFELADIDSAMRWAVADG